MLDLAPRSVPTLAPVNVRVEPGHDSAFVLRSATPLRQHDPTIGPWLERWARERPDQTFLAQRPRPHAPWEHLTYGTACARARAIGQALVERGLDLQRPVMILSGNSLSHATLTLGALSVGVPVVPVSAAYSLMSRDHHQLQHIVDLATPGLIFAESSAAFGPALAALDLEGIEVVTEAEFHELLRTPAGQSQATASAAVTGQTVAKILMTSGSTGRPKGVINTHGMLTANQAALAQAWPFVDDTPVVLVDWLPWSHTFGANHNFHLVLRTGGTLYIDGGRPAPGLFDTTVSNLTEVAPTLQFNVPAGYGMLAAALERDRALRESFFSRLQGIFYAAAALPQDTWERLDRAAEATLGHRVWLTTSWGATETSPLVTSAHFASERADNIGLPVPGCELKFVPAGAKLELRVRGPNVTPGYHRDPVATARAFDVDGFYRIGDAGQLVDPERPEAGVRFDGRVSEDFKLSTGTWVSVGQLRTAALSACGGLMRNAVVAGHDRDAIALLAWLDADQCAALVPDGADLTTDPAVHDALRDRLRDHNATAGGRSRQVARVMLLAAPPDLDGGEITDKGYINAAAVLRNRSNLVDRCFGEGGPDVIQVV